MAIKFKGVDFIELDTLLSDDERLVRDNTRKFIEDNLIPIIELCNREGRFPKELIKPMGELGFYGASLKGYGCAGMSAVEYGLMTQELERGDSGVRSFVSVQSGLCMYPIYAFGSEEQKQKYLPKMALGEILGCFGLTEPDAGSNPGAMRTRARKDGDGYVLNGEKMWITSGSIADIAIIWAKVEDEDNLIRGFIVETDRPGFKAADVHGKWSLRASVTSSLSLQDVRIPAENLLPESGGLKSPLSCLNQARYGIAWGAIGAAMACYDCALQYAQFRKQFRDQPIAVAPARAGEAGVDDQRDHQGATAGAAGWPPEGRGQSETVAHLHGQAQQRLDGAGVRAHGPRHPGRQRHRRRVSHLPPHGQPGVGEDLRGHARHPHADHRRAHHRARRVLRLNRKTMPWESQRSTSHFRESSLSMCMRFQKEIKLIRKSDHVCTPNLRKPCLTASRRASASVMPVITASFRKCLRWVAQMKKGNSDREA